VRILHTSDWHLGQLFYQYDRTEEHERFLDWLLETLSTERADALLIAGDVFDHANPSAIAHRLFYRFLTDARTRNPHLSIVVVSGNHDSPGRLEAPSPFCDALGITVVGQVPRRPEGGVDASRLVVPLRDRTGGVAAWCLAVPFLRTGDLPTTGADVATPEDPAGAPVSTRGPYAAGVARIYHHALEAALSVRRDGQAIIALGHCSVEGGILSLESERPILAGGLDALTSDVFSGHLAYVALGHLHRPQQVGDETRLRYSGSPMPLSFAEIDYPHQVVRVDLDGDALTDVRPIPVPRFAPLLRVPKEPAPPDEVLAALRSLRLPETAAHLRPYVEARVRIDRPEPGLRSLIEEALATKPVRLARIELTYPQATPGVGTAPARSLDDLATLQPDSVFREVYRDRFGTDAPPEFTAAFGELLRMPATEIPS
jgi:exonuclease SbcD